MVDIIIKSFNRPYYLERCLASIRMHARGDFKVKIIDDGTPAHFLEEITKRFPDVSVFRSTLYSKKTRAIEDHLSKKSRYDIFEIPTQSWIELVGASSDIFLLLEEDSWLTGDINLDDYERIMSEHNVVHLKLYWGGNPLLIQGERYRLGSEAEGISPDLVTNNGLLASFLLERRFRIHSILSGLHLIKRRQVLSFYTLYTTASALYRKDYWMYLWRNAGSFVDEHLQLLNALRYYKSNPRAAFAKTTNEKVLTSYLTSTVDRSGEVDFVAINTAINNIWMARELEAMQGYPLDFSIKYLQQFIPPEEKDRWRIWVAAFQEQFRTQGFVIK